MARKKKEETIEEVKEEIKASESVVVKEQELNTSEEESTIYERATPFGVEVWDPKTKTTTMKTHG